MLESVFWGSLLLTIYTYFIFPVLLFVLARGAKGDKTHHEKENTGERSVAILCAMYNEEKVVREKINNFFKLNYRNIKLYVGSDGSSDSTNSILREYAGKDRIMTYEFPRRGKVHVINDLVSYAKEDIIIFTDANSMFETNTVKNLVRHFDSPDIGAVCGRLCLVSQDNETGEGFYWKYETMIKKMEDRLDCVIGANGAVYAVRRELLKPLPADTINDDFTNSMRVIEQGYGVKYEENAVAIEEVNHDDSVEFQRHVRDGAGHYRAMLVLYRILNPFKGKPFFLYVSHRVIRWFVPFFMIMMIVIPPFIKKKTPLLKITCFFQTFFYLDAVAGHFTRTKFKPVYIPYYFLKINLALLVGFFKTILGLQKAAWNSTER